MSTLAHKYLDTKRQHRQTDKQAAMGGCSKGQAKHVINVHELQTLGSHLLQKICIHAVTMMPILMSG